MLRKDRLFSVTGLFALSIFTSAFLLFMVQPLFSKIVLPSLGGASAVWITLMFVYQGLLLLGYGYAHALSHWVPQRLQIPLHLLLLIASFLMLPLAAHADLTLPETAHPILWLIKTALLGVGLPFFVLSATSPLIQHWFAHTPHGKNKNPYVLYAVSNFGSLLALLGYPLLLERFLPLSQQSDSWLGVYMVYALLLFVCGLTTHTLWRKTRVSEETKLTADPIKDKNLVPQVSKGRMFHWLLLALVPSSMLLGVTGYITTQITSLPLLWVVPLALYLCTFIFAFAEKQVLPPKLVRTLAGIGLVGVIAIVAMRQNYTDTAMLWHLGTFFFIALALHQILAEKKPAAKHLTGFYFIMSLGGVLGGAVNAIAAPLLFNNVYEYPLILAIAGILLWPYQRQYVTELYESKRLARGFGLFFDIAVPLTLFLLVTLPGHNLRVGKFSLDFRDEQSLHLAIIATVLLALVSFQKPFRLAVGAALILAGGLFINTLSDSHTLTTRSFYSTYSVVFDSDKLAYKLLTLGTSATQGAQSIDPEHALRTTYFYNLDGADTKLPEDIYASDWASIGLGVGTIACLSPLPNKTTFIEIDPMVYELAHDSGYFTYLQDCPGQNPVIIGDGRAKLENFAENSLGLIALDAFSGSSIPTHILTREAFEMYLTKLKPNGVIMVNISNRHINLLPLLTRQAKELGLVGMHRTPRPPKFSHWMMLSREKASIAGLAEAGWEPLPEADMSLQPWTDSFATILPLLDSKWRDFVKADKARKKAEAEQ